MKLPKTPAKKRATKTALKKDREPGLRAGNLSCRCVVGVGASAGGLEALRAFFKGIPQDSGAAFVVVGHHGAEGTSELPRILSSSSNLDVCWAAHHMPVEPNRVYISPAGKDLIIKSGLLEFIEVKPGGNIRLPVDFFLRSLAGDCGEKSVAVILSGTGMDGSHGLREIKEAGGLALVQSRSSAEFNGMPGSSIATGLADFILSPQELAAALLNFLNHQLSSRPPQGSPGNLEALAQMRKLTALMKRHTALDLGAYKESSVARRIERRMGICQIRDFEDYVTLAHQAPAECEKLAKDMLISVTRFFRDPEVFDKLRTSVLPDMIRKARGRALRIWSVGCATGEEVYSTAILLEEAIRQQEEPGEVDYKIFATDLDRSALEHAGKGIFPETIKTDVPEDFLEKYFIKQGKQYQIARRIREKIVFARQNILRDPPFTKLDLISCRNVLIYLQQAHQQRVLSLLHFSLNPGGALLLGLSEAPGEAGSGFAPIDTKLRIYRKKNDAALSLSEVLSFGGITPFSAVVPDPQGSLSPSTDRRADRLLEDFASDVIARLGHTCFVLNRKLEVLYSFGKPEDFVTLPSGRSSLRLPEIAPRELSAAISTAAGRVIKDRAPVTYASIDIGQDGKKRAVDLRIEAFKPDQSDLDYLLVFLEKTDKSRRPKPTVFDSADTVQRIRDLEDELQAKKESLQVVVEELEASNEELQTSNEELQASNEELQSTNEELQSTNEELQSVNEELQTVNVECQGKIRELVRTNEDIDNFITGADIATVFLDAGMRIRKFTPTAARQTGLLPQDLGRLITELAHPLLVLAAKAARKIIAGNKKVEAMLSQKSGGDILMRVTPFLPAVGERTGATVSFINIGRIGKTRRIPLG
ncbi:MAG: CheR family methyltransferase [Terrimicrobiaceae bacterium]